jgi:hypothetical protein
MVESKRKRRQRSPGMPHHHGAIDAEQPERLREQGGLGRRRPFTPAWAFTVPEPRPIERHGTISLRSFVDDPADEQVLGHGAIAVQEHDRPARSALDVVEAHSTRGYEPASRREL